jgi:hypothetical protein
MSLKQVLCAGLTARKGRETTRRRCLFAKSTARQEGEESGGRAYPRRGGLARHIWSQMSVLDNE